MKHLGRLNSNVLAAPIVSDCRERSGRLGVRIRVGIGEWNFIPKLTALTERRVVA